MRNDYNSDGTLNRAFIDRFWSKTETMPSGCIEWRGMLNSREPYGICGIRDGQKQIRVLAHRIAHHLATGADILKNPDTIVRHKCDNPACVNPDHLDVGSHLDNVRDRVDRHRSARGEANGRSKFTEETVRIIRHVVGAGVMSAGDVARVAGVDPKAIRNIISGKSWGHV